MYNKAVTVPSYHLKAYGKVGLGSALPRVSEKSRNVVGLANQKAQREANALQRRSSDWIR